MYGPLASLAIREAVSDHYLSGIRVRRGTLVNLSLQGNHFNEKYFERPFDFVPERWENSKDVAPFVMGGFSNGARTCIGKSLVQLESKIALIKFMRRYCTIRLPKEKIRIRLDLIFAAEKF